MTIADKDVHVILSLMVFIKLPARLVHLADSPVSIVTDSERPDNTIIGFWLSVFSKSIHLYDNVLGCHEGLRSSE